MKVRPNSVQNVGEHPSPDVLHGVGVLEHVVAHLTRTEESVAFWTQTNELFKNPSALRFVAL